MDIPQDPVEPMQSTESLPVDAPVHGIPSVSKARTVSLNLAAPQLAAVQNARREHKNPTTEVRFANSRDENVYLKNRLKLAEKDYQKLQEKIATLEEKNEKLQKTNSEVNAALETKETDFLELTGKLQSSNDKVGLLEKELQTKLGEWEIEKKLQDGMIGKLKHEKDVFEHNLKKNNFEVNAALEMKERDLLKVAGELRSSNYKVCWLEIEKNVLKKKLGEREFEKDVFEYNLGISRILFNNLRDEHQELKKDCEEQKVEMMKHVNEKQETNEQIEKLKDSVKTLEVEVSKKTSRVQRLKEDKSKLRVLAEIHGQEASSKKKFPSSSYVKRSVIGVHRTNLTLLRLVGNVRREMSEVVESNQTIWKMYVRKVVELDYAKEKITSLEESAQAVVEMEADAPDGEGDSDGDPQIPT